MTSMTDRLNQAADWFVTLNEGPIEDSERAAFDKWFSETANASAFVQVSRASQTAKSADIDPQISAWLEDARSRGSSTPSPAAKLSATSPKWLAIAATVVVGVLMGLLMLLEESAVRYQTALGERQTIILADSSTLELDASSAVLVDYSDSRRVLTLEAGRAQFDVAHDPNRPFVVQFEGQTITALGTSFSVESLAGELRVILLEGSIEVDGVPGLDRHQGTPAGQPTGDKVVLEPGETLVVAEQKVEITRFGAAEIAEVASWQSGLLTFEDEPLDKVIGRFNRYSSTTIELASKEIAEVSVSGTYRADNVSALLEGLREIHAVEADRSGSTIRLSRQDPES